MGGCPGESGESIEQGDPVVGDMIQEIRFPHRHMIVIVCDDGYRYGKIKGEDIEGPVKTNFPLNKEGGGCNTEIKESLKISDIFEHRGKRYRNKTGIIGFYLINR